MLRAERILINSKAVLSSREDYVSAVPPLSQVIIVLDAVRVGEPYTPEVCTSEEDHKATCERVRTVLRRERERLGLMS